MLRRAAFGKVFQFLDDYVLRGRHPNPELPQFEETPMLHAPLLQPVARWIDIGFESGFVMDQIEMRIHRSVHFRDQNFNWRTIEFIYREECRKGFRFIRLDIQYQINIMRHTRRTMENYRDGTGYHIMESALFERLYESPDQLKWLHGRIFP